VTIKTRLQKLATKLKPDDVKIYYMGWADCTWGESEGLVRQAGESKEDFCNRVYQTTKKHFLWFD
jgi:hypothetical protein